MGEVFTAFLRLGLTAFGGPVVHIGYFRDEFVRRRGWLDDTAYADLVALCQFLPGPASSQVGIGLGLMRAGLPGALAAWCAFTLPSALLMGLAAFSLIGLGAALPEGMLAGLKAVVVGVVAHALVGMAGSLTPDARRRALAFAALVLALVLGGISGQLAAIGLGAVAGALLLSPAGAGGGAGEAGSPLRGIRRRTGAIPVAVAIALLLALPLLARFQAETQGALPLAIADGFYRAGALVFGGGHVVLPLLEAETVRAGHVDAAAFTAGYGLAQAVPGPLFTFSAYLGGVAGLAAGLSAPAAAMLAALALVMIFLPGALLVVGLLPWWGSLRASAVARRTLNGVNAAVVGILAAALYDPVLLTAVDDAGDIAIALAAWAALALLHWPAWAVVPMGAGLGIALAQLPPGLVPGFVPGLAGG